MPENTSRRQRSEEIDAHLKRAFDSLTEEAIPDRLADLLIRLRAEEHAGAGGACDRTVDRATANGTPSAPSAPSAKGRVSASGPEPSPGTASAKGHRGTGA